MSLPRIRSIKPEFFTDDVLAQLPVVARLAFIGLWCWADWCGRLEDRPHRLKVQILPFERDLDFESVLRVLAEGQFIQRYEVDGRKYLQVRTFATHQRVRSDERASVLPPPPRDEHVTRPVPVRDVRETEPSQGTGTGTGTGTRP